MAPTRNKRSNIRLRASKAKNVDPRGNYAPPPINIESSDELDNGLDSKTELKSAMKRKRDAEDEEMDWRLNKRDKRTIKHNVFLAKVRDSGIQKKTPKRRRPGNKLKADIGNLADALPDLDDDGDLAANGSEDEWEGVSDDDGDGENDSMQVDGGSGSSKRNRRRRPTTTDGKMVMKSLKHRPGAMKRKRKMEDAEMERFRKNLAQMASRSSNVARSQANIELASHGPASASSSSAAAAAAHQADKWAALRNFIGSTMQKDKAFAVG